MPFLASAYYTRGSILASPNCAAAAGTKLLPRPPVRRPDSDYILLMPTRLFRILRLVVLAVLFGSNRELPWNLRVTELPDRCGGPDSPSSPASCYDPMKLWNRLPVLPLARVRH